MDVVLGVSVRDTDARLALVGDEADGGRTVVDQCVVDLPGSNGTSVEKDATTLTSTILGTRDMLAANRHQLVGVRMCSTDSHRASAMRDALVGAGVDAVEVLSPSEAATALVRDDIRATGRDRSALLLLTSDTATLSVVDPRDGSPTVLATEHVDRVNASAVCAGLIGWMHDSGAADDVTLVGLAADTEALADELRLTSALHVNVPDQPQFAIARGAALADSLNLPPEAIATAMSPHLASQLAYSQVESEPFGIDYLDPVPDSPAPVAPSVRIPEEFDDDPALEPRRTKFLLLGSMGAGLVVVAATAFAVTAVVGVNPMVNQQPATQTPKGATFAPNEGARNLSPGQGSVPEAHVPPSAPAAAAPVDAPSQAPAANAPAAQPGNNSAPVEAAPATPGGPPAEVVTPAPVADPGTPPELPSASPPVVPQITVPIPIPIPIPMPMPIPIPIPGSPSIPNVAPSTARTPVAPRPTVTSPPASAPSASSPSGAPSASSPSSQAPAATQTSTAPSR